MFRTSFFANLDSGPYPNRFSKHLPRCGFWVGWRPWRRPVNSRQKIKKMNYPQKTPGSLPYLIFWWLYDCVFCYFRVFEFRTSFFANLDSGPYPNRFSKHLPRCGFWVGWRPWRRPVNSRQFFKKMVSYKFDQGGDPNRFFDIVANENIKPQGQNTSAQSIRVATLMRFSHDVTRNTKSSKAWNRAFYIVFLTIL